MGSLLVKLNGTGAPDLGMSISNDLSTANSWVYTFASESLQDAVNTPNKMVIKTSLFMPYRVAEMSTDTSTSNRIEPSSDNVVLVYCKVTALCVKIKLAN